jgi:hypothetical protein
VRVVSKWLHTRLSYQFEVCIPKLLCIISVCPWHTIEVHVPPGKLRPYVNLLIRINEPFKYLKLLVFKAIMDIDLVEALVRCRHYCLPILMFLRLIELLLEIQRRN